MFKALSHQAMADLAWFDTIDHIWSHGIMQWP